MGDQPSQMPRFLSGFPSDHEFSRMSKWEISLTNPWEWRPMRGGLGPLGGNKDFDCSSTQPLQTGWRIRDVGECLAIFGPLIFEQPCLNRPAQRPRSRTPLQVPPWLPREAGQSEVPSPDRQALPMALRPKAAACLPSLPTCWLEALVHHGPAQLPSSDPWPASPAPLVPRQHGRTQPAAAPASWKSGTLPNASDWGV